MNNKRLRALLGAGVLTAAMAFTNIADAATKYAMTTANLNFRTGPSTSNKIITTIKKNTKVEVVSYDGKWAKIKYNNQLGYSSKDYLSEVSSSSGSTSTTKKTGTVTTDVLNIRSGAGTSYSKIGTLKKGATVKILQTSKGWHKIELSGSKTGWVSADYIKITTSSNSGSTSGGSSSSGSTSTTKKTGTVTTDVLNIRSGAGTSYSKIGTLKKGATVKILQTSKGWHKIELSGSKTGWVSADYIKITTSSNSGSTSGGDSSSGSNNNGSGSNNNTSGGNTENDSNDNSTEESNEIGIVTTDVLNVRSGAGVSYSVVTQITKNTKVTILSSNDGWYKIKLSDGTTGWVSASYIKIDNGSSTTQQPLPIPTSTPTYVDAPVNTEVMNSEYDKYQNMLTMKKDVSEGLKSLSIKSNEDFDVEYSIYGSGSWKTASNGAALSSSTIEGVKINLKNAPSNYHIFYRVKVANQGWQNWVKDGDISGEIKVNKAISDIEIRVVVSDSVNHMVKETIAVDLGHNVARPVLRGAVNGIYDEDYLIREVGKKVVYKLRSLGYNVVETKPTGSYSQSDELKLRAQAANANEVDKFVSIHFNSGDKGANGTEVYYSTVAGSKSLATNVTNNIANSFSFKNRGAKDGSHLYVLKNTQMPAILVEGCFLDQIDMDKFISKGSQAYQIMADNIVNGIIK